VRSRFQRRVRRALHVETFCVDRYLRQHIIRRDSVYSLTTATQAWHVPAANSVFALAETYNGANFFPIIPHAGWIPLDVAQTSSTASFDAGHVRGSKITITSIEVAGEILGRTWTPGAIGQSAGHYVQFGLAHFNGPNDSGMTLTLADFWDTSLTTSLDDSAFIDLPRVPYRSATTNDTAHTQRQWKVIKKRTVYMGPYPELEVVSTGAATDWPLVAFATQNPYHKRFHWRFKVNKTITMASRPILDTGQLTWNHNWYFFARSSAGTGAVDRQSGPLFQWLHFRFRYMDV